MIDQISEALIDLQYAIKSSPIAVPEPMLGDQWLAASCLQKSLRRGDVSHALKAGYALWCQDRQSFWRRLHVAALEDIGIVNPSAIVATLTATAAPAWRRKVGDLRVALHLIRLLCESEKTRVADELLIQAERAPGLTRLRSRLAEASDEYLSDAMTDKNTVLIERVLAAWYLAGTRRFASDSIPPRRGQPEDAADVLRTLDTPPTLVEACISVLTRTQWPLALFTPIIWESAAHEIAAAKIQQAPLPVINEVNGVPTFACDMFTRTGQSAFRRLQKELPDLKPFTIKQIGLAVFYREGGLTDKTLTSPFFDDIRLAGECADVECAGLPLPEYMALREILANEWPLLEALRVQQLNRYFDGADSCAA